MFSGSDIVRWMVQNIVGIENEQDGETLGQILLDKGAIFHSEGSRYKRSLIFLCLTRA